MVVHQASLWWRGLIELGNGLFDYSVSFQILAVDIVPSHACLLRNLFHLRKRRKIREILLNEVRFKTLLVLFDSITDNDLRVRLNQR